MKHILLKGMLILVFAYMVYPGSQESKGQLIDPAGAMQDAAQTAALKELSVVQTKSLANQFKDTQLYAKMLAMKEGMQRLRENSAFLRDLKSYKRLVDLIAMMACQLQELEFNLRLADQTNCLVNINYNMILVRFEGSMDMMWLAAGATASAITMEPSERAGLLHRSIDLLEETITNIQKFNTSIQLSVRNKLRTAMFYETMDAHFDLRRY